MEKISYKIKKYDNNGTYYNQCIKCDFETMNKICKKIIEEKNNKYQNYKKYACDSENYADMFLLHLNETHKIYMKNGVMYFLNKTTTNFIKYILKNNRILSTKNTVLFYSYNMNKKII